MKWIKRDFADLAGMSLSKFDKNYVQPICKMMNITIKRKRLRYISDL